MMGARPCAYVHDLFTGQRMTSPRLFLLVSLAMTAFAGNSILTRLALGAGWIDATSFTTVRLVSGAVALVFLRRLRVSSDRGLQSRSTSALPIGLGPGIALFVYAATFSFAYAMLPAGAGALLLFGAVQTTMIAVGYWRGEQLNRAQAAGFALALSGLTAMLLPGLAAPPTAGALLMIAAGVAWGIYSLMGRNARDPMQTNAVNFSRAALMSLVLSAAMRADARLEPRGAVLAVVAGAVTSGIGYVIWYAALRGLTATRAASVQLLVPVLAAAGGVVFMHEAVSVRLSLSCAAILGGIALVLMLGPATPTTVARQGKPS